MIDHCALPSTNPARRSVGCAPRPKAGFLYFSYKIWHFVMAIFDGWQRIQFRVPLTAQHAISGAGSTGRGGTCAPLLQIAGHGGWGTVSRRTANKKLTKLYWPTRKRAPTRLILFLEPKKWRGTTKKKKKLWHFAPDLCPPPTLAPDRCPRLSNSFRRHCQRTSAIYCLHVQPATPCDCRLRKTCLKR